MLFFFLFSTILQQTFNIKVKTIKNIQDTDKEVTKTSYDGFMLKTSIFEILSLKTRTEIKTTEQIDLSKDKINLFKKINEIMDSQIKKYSIYLDNIDYKNKILSFIQSIYNDERILSHYLENIEKYDKINSFKTIADFCLYIYIETLLGFIIDGSKLQNMNINEITNVLLLVSLLYAADNQRFLHEKTFINNEEIRVDFKYFITEVYDNRLENEDDMIENDELRHINNRFYILNLFNIHFPVDKIENSDNGFIIKIDNIIKYIFSEQLCVPKKAGVTLHNLYGVSVMDSFINEYLEGFNRSRFSTECIRGILKEIHYCLVKLINHVNKLKKKKKPIPRSLTDEKIAKIKQDCLREVRVKLGIGMNN